MENKILKTPELRKIEAAESFAHNWEIFVQTFRSSIAILVLWTMASFVNWLINLF
ncbi:hypothetical protein [Henriciella sp.]|jgi:hypothetical protein|uniref:hypothetical protein n=1 Tax=Henriciella sp. TaxID=1968823 RepID=UPI0025BCFD89|nr:hypothetical protein [Henriciella sp.]